MIWRVVATALVLAIPCAARGDAAGDFEMVFGEEARKVAATRDTRDDAALAAKVVQAAKLAPDAPKSQIYFYQKAHELGVRHINGYPHAIEALELLEKAAPRRSAEWRGKKLTILEAAYKRARGAARQMAAKAYLDVLLDAADSSAASGRADEARAVFERAHPIAVYLRSPLAGQIAARIKRMEALAAAAAKRQARLKTLMSKVAGAPQDMAARTELILFCLTELDAPGKAATLLAKGLDEKLVQRVRLAAGKPEELPQAACLELGRWYHESLVAKAPADVRAALLARAATYYERYLGLYSKQDVKRLSAKLSLAEIREQLAKVAPDEARATKTKGTVYVSAGGRYELRLNGRIVLAGGGTGRAESADVALKVDDVITVRAEAGSGSGLCLIFQGEGGIELSTNRATWFCYVPRDAGKWWHGGASGKSAAGAGKDSRPARLVALAAGRSAATAYESIWGEGKRVFLSHVVGAAEMRRIRWVSKDARYTVSSKSTWNGRPLEPMAALLTGAGRLHSNNQFAFQTQEEARPHVIITLNRVAAVRRILIENRRGRYQERAAGLTVWVSTDKSRWTRVWTAPQVRARWQIEVKKVAKARYVKVGLAGRGVLHLAAVRIYE